MQTIKCYCLSAVLIIGIYSCGSKKTETILVDPLNCVQLDDFFDTCRTVILDSTRQAMISNPGKIIKKDFLYYIHDENRQSILIFDTTGNFISEINHLGRSSMEYTQLTNFDVFNGYIYIIARADQKILRYDTSGNFVGYCKLDDWYSEFLVINNDSILLFSNYSNDKFYNYILFDWNMEESLSECDKFSINSSFTAWKNHLGIFDDDIYTTKPFDYNIYKYANGDIKPVINLSFNTKDKLKNDKNVSTIAKNAEGKKVIKYYNGFTKVEDRYYVMYNMLFPNVEFGADFISMVNETDSTSISACLGLQRTEKYPFGFNYASLCGDVLIAFVSPTAYQKITSSKLVNENSNYVLLEYKLK